MTDNYHIGASNNYYIGTSANSRLRHLLVMYWLASQLELAMQRRIAEDARRALGRYYKPIAQAKTVDQVEAAVEEMCRTYRGSIRPSRAFIYRRGMWHLKRLRNR